MKKIFFLILIFTHSGESKEIPQTHVSVDSLENYFPLELGNAYQFFKRETGSPSCFSSTQFRIDRDSVIDQKRYFWVKDLWLRMDSTGKLFYYISSTRQGIVMDFSLESGQKLDNKSIIAGSTEVFGKIIPWKGFEKYYVDPYYGLQSYEVMWGYGVGKIYEYSSGSGPGTGYVTESSELIQFIKNVSDSLFNFSYDYYPEMVYTPVDTIMSPIFNMSIQVDHYYSYLTPPCYSFQFIESITIESHYKHLDSIIINTPLKIYSNPDSININATYTLDTSLIKNGFEFYYRIQAKDKGVIPHYSYKPDTGYYKVTYGNLTIVEDKKPDNQPNEFALYQNYPNPFNPETVISYQLAVPSKVQLKIHDILGREISTLVNEYQNDGIHHSTFSALNNSLPSGVYYYTLTTSNYTVSKKMMYLK